MTVRTASKPTNEARRVKSLVLPLLSRCVTHIVLGGVILILDLLTGRFLLFPIFFIIPVILSAWFCGARLAYVLAILLPAGRLFISIFIEEPAPLPSILANGAIRVAVLTLIAFLVSRTSRQTKQLQDRVDTLVTICAWSRTVEYEGEWISFEQYLRRRFGVDTTHGISPAQAAKAFDHAPARDVVG